MKEIAYWITENPALKFMGIKVRQAHGISQTFLAKANYAAFN